MNQHTPPGITPHIPADTWARAQATGAPVVIVVHGTTPTGIPWRRILTVLAVTGAAAMGGWGLVVAVCAVLDATAHLVTIIAGAAGPLGIGGITLRLTRKH
ncbi:hypothetical protein PV379_30205 [Streptomyces caniscabiei]|uniref:hypothetical protein n=1 Tax=Streptomyces caniscabiei TaxID=2746961 RepID=UPI0029B639E8|nr:hypothetical protein [Streptomyces caniscabiei]MDX2601610.1 hypothetical protein [Streptomyces caniscabiei]MDX2741812.1 hypothetical protein [Streptomyces caniscabiei]MDX2781546.1 hypothetical protein [Streptomyces caniscabiei]